MHCRIAWLVLVPIALVLVPIALVLVSVAPGTRVHAQAPVQPGLPLQLDWRAPADCSSAADVRAELERIARVRPGATLEPLVARAEVERRGTVYRAQLATEHAGQRGERTLDAADCKTLVRTVTLVLALTFGRGVEVASEPASEPTSGQLATSAEPAPALAEQSSAATSEGEAKPSSEPARTQNQPREALLDPPLDKTLDEPAFDPRDPQRAPLEWALLIGAGAQLGLLPSTGFAASAGVELDAGALMVGLRATAWPGVSEGFEDGVSTRFDGLAATLQGCGQLPIAALSVALCGGARVAALRGRSSGAGVLAAPREAVAPWYAGHGALSASWPSSAALQLRIEGALAASLNRPRFVVQSGDSAQREAHRVPSLVPELSAALVLRL